VNSVYTNLSDTIPGVFQASQPRSIRIRDAYVEAGIDLLNSIRFHDLKISVLAANCGYSVGSFYTRFQDKDAYFKALRLASVTACNHDVDNRVTPEKLSKLSVNEALDELVDLMADIFTGRFRGVLREALLRILEPGDPWAPMRDSARRIIGYYHEALAGSFNQFSEEDTKTRISFCFQIIVGVLQNDLVNDYHVFSTKDQSLRAALKENLRCYMNV